MQVFVAPQSLTHASGRCVPAAPEVPPSAIAITMDSESTMTVASATRVRVPVCFTVWTPPMLALPLWRLLGYCNTSEGLSARGIRGESLEEGTGSHEVAQAMDGPRRLGSRRVPGGVRARLLRGASVRERLRGRDGRRERADLVRRLGGRGLLP